MMPGTMATTMAMTMAAAAGAAVLLCAGLIVWAIRRRTAPRIDSAEEAAQAAETALPGFVTAGAVVGADGSAALAVGADGRVAAMRRRGKRIAACEVPWTAVRSTPEGILIDTGDRRVGRVALTGVDALDIRRLAPVGLRA